MSERAKLSERQKQVLYRIIRSYSLDGNPVGSRWISKNLETEKLSPATIRNVMSDLEEMGYLQQPHVSAGRVPTDTAYRMLVQELINTKSFSFDKQRIIKNKLTQHRDNLDEFFKSLPDVLSDVSGHIGIVLTPKVDQVICRNIRFVKINDKKILAVIVANTGMVHDKLIEVAEPFTQDELDRISNLVRSKFMGLTISQIMSEIRTILRAEKAQYDKLLKNALELSSKSFENIEEEETGVYYSGTDHVFTQISREQYERMIDLYRTFEDKTKLLMLLQHCLKENDINVIIGNENELSGFEDMSLISAAYSSGGRILGTLAVLGPKWMNYDSSLGIIYYSTKLVSNFLTESGF